MFLIHRVPRASKAAVEMLAQFQSRELAAGGIKVNALFPSVQVDTGFVAHLEGAERQALAPPDIINEPALFPATLTAGALKASPGKAWFS